MVGNTWKPLEDRGHLSPPAVVALTPGAGRLPGGARGVWRRSFSEAEDVALRVSQDPPPQQAVRKFRHRDRELPLI